MLEEKKEVIGIDTCMAESRMSSGAGCEKKRGKRQDPAAARKEAGLEQPGFGLWLHCPLGRKNWHCCFC